MYITNWTYCCCTLEMSMYASNEEGSLVLHVLWQQTEKKQPHQVPDTLDRFLSQHQIAPGHVWGAGIMGAAVLVGRG